MNFQKFAVATKFFLVIPLTIGLFACSDNSGDCNGSSGGNNGSHQLPINSSSCINQDQSVFFEFDASQGVTYKLTLTSNSGDSDFALYSDDTYSDSSVILYSTDITTTEILMITSETDQIYYIEVYGFEAGNYTLQARVAEDVELGFTFSTNNLEYLAVRNYSLPETQSIEINHIAELHAGGFSTADLTSSASWLTHQVQTTPSTSIDIGISNVTLAVDVYSANLRVYYNNPKKSLYRDVSLHYTLLGLDTPAQLDHITSLSSGFTIPANVTGISYELKYAPAGMAISSDGQLAWTPVNPMFNQQMDFNYGIDLTYKNSHYSLSDAITVTDNTRKEVLARTDYEQPPFARSGMRTDDFDNDGKNEILMTDGGKRIYTLEYNNGDYIQDWVYPYDIGQGHRINTITAHDINSDNYDEIFIIASNVIKQNSKIIVLDGITRKIIKEVPLVQSLPLDMEVSDINNDGSAEIVVLYSSSLYPNTQFQIISTSDYSELWASAPDDFGIYFEIGNVDADPSLEIVTMNGYIINGNNFSAELNYPDQFDYYASLHDINGDDIEEIAFIKNNQVSVYSALTQSFIYQSAVDVAQGYVLNNFDNDANIELLIASTNGVDASVLQYDQISGNFIPDPDVTNLAYTFWSNPLVADTDNDNQLEFIRSKNAATTAIDLLLIDGGYPTITNEWVNNNPAQHASSDFSQIPYVGGNWVNTSPQQKELIYGAVKTSSFTDINGLTPPESGARLISVDPVTNKLHYSPRLGLDALSTNNYVIDDYDGDGVEEFILGFNNSFTGSYIRVYDYAANSTELEVPIPGNGRLRALTNADINNDGHSDVVAITSVHISGSPPKTQLNLFIYDIYNDRQISTTYLGIFSAGTSVTLLRSEDIDNDSTKEIIFSLKSVDTSLYVLGKIAGQPGYQMLSAVKTPVFNNISSFLILDTDGDNQSEIIASVNSRAGTGAYISNIITYNNDLVEINNFQVDYSINAIFSESNELGGTNLILSASNFLMAVDQKYGNEVWRSPFLIGPIINNGLSFADADNNGIFEFIFSTSEAIYRTR